MWRTSAIESLLLTEIAGLYRRSSRDGDGPPESVTRAELDAARRRARFVVALDWLAIVVLFASRNLAAPWLEVGPRIETVFTLGVVAVAVHSGFRLGQLEKLSSIGRALDELAARASPRS